MLCNIKPLHPNKDMYILCLYLLIYTFLMVHVQDKESVMAFLVGHDVSFTISNNLNVLLSSDTLRRNKMPVILKS